MKIALLLALSAVIPAAVAQTADSFDWHAKLQYHTKKSFGPVALLGFAAYAAALQDLNSPKEWGQGGAAYGERFASTVAWAGIHGTLAFGLDSTLHQDPRYYRSTSTGFLRRAGHAIRGTVVTHTDAGGETFATWRFGADYGAAFLSDLWYPARLNTPRQGLIHGSITLGFDAIANLGAEFWPDIRRKVFVKK